MPEKLSVPIQPVTPPATAATASARTYQLLSRLTASDGSYDDNLDFCLITLNAAQTERLLDAYRTWRKTFPTALELVIADTDFIAQYLTDDESDALDVPENSDYRILANSPVTLTEEDNDPAAWNIVTRKIVIRQETISFVAVYESNYELQRAFTASPELTIGALEEMLFHCRG